MCSEMQSTPALDTYHVELVDANKRKAHCIQKPKIAVHSLWETLLIVVCRFFRGCSSRAFSFRWVFDGEKKKKRMENSHQRKRRIHDMVSREVCTALKTPRVYVRSSETEEIFSLDYGTSNLLFYIYIQMYNTYIGG